MDRGIDTFAIRSLWGKNIAELDHAKLRVLNDLVHQYDISISSILSPLFKCYVDPILGDKNRATHSYEHFIGFSPDLEDHEDLLKRLIVVSKRLTVSRIRVFGFLRSGRVQMKHVEKKIGERLREAARQAQESGITLLLENEHTCFVDTIEAATRFVESQLEAAKNVKLAVDPCNHVLSRSSADVFDWVKEARNVMLDIHVKDVTKNGKYVVMGNGVVGWSRILNFLNSSNYDHYVTLEPHLNRRRLNDSIKQMKKWLR